jgi:hypothetical protein
MRVSCPSGEWLRIANPWADGRAVSVPCDVLVSLTCAQGDGDLDTCALQDLRGACEQTLASRDGDDPGLLGILCALSATFLPELACVAVFSEALGVPCFFSGGALGYTIDTLGCTLA